MFKSNESGQSTVGTAFAVIGGIVAALLVIYLFGYFVVGFNRGPGKQILKTQVSNERTVNENSQQYGETQARAMRDQITQYNTNAVELAKAQQNPEANAEVIKQLNVAQQGIITFVRTQSKTLPDDAVPSDIRAFLSAH